MSALNLQEVIGIVVSLIGVGVPLAVAVQQRLWKTVRIIAKEEGAKAATASMKTHLTYAIKTEKEVVDLGVRLGRVESDVVDLTSIAQIQFFWAAKENPKMMSELYRNNEPLYNKFAKRFNGDLDRIRTGRR
jgi:hypothetical protein